MPDEWCLIGLGKSRMMKNKPSVDESSWQETTISDTIMEKKQKQRGDYEIYCLWTMENYVI